MANDKVTVRAQCEACDGTGLIESPSPLIGLVCNDCDGKGERELSYTPFNGRVNRLDIRSVTASKYSVLGIISYEQFLQGKRPRS